MSQIGVDVLKNNLTNPARIYMWEVIIPNPIGGGDSDVLRVRCQSAQIPERIIGTILIPYKQTAGVNFAGKNAYTHIWEVTFIEGEDKKVHDAMYAWMQTIIDDVDGVGDGDDMIKQGIYLNLLSTKNEIDMTLKLIGAFPVRMGLIDLTYAEERAITYPITFSFDSWLRV